MYFNEEHKQRVINRGDNYKYIGTYKRNEITIDGKNKMMNHNYIRVKCRYWGKEYDVRLDRFNEGSKCSYCCNKYENSFAYHIEIELGAKLEDYWDYEENGRRDINPWDIYKSSGKVKIWIWCQNKWYHGSYHTTANKFTSKGTRCGFCTNIKVHPKDSFGQWLIDTYGNDAIEKYWSPKNILNPFKIAKGSSSTQVWILCQEKDYHNDNGGYKILPNDFYQGHRCPYCNRNSGKVHPNDSFGALYPSKAKYWSEKNDKSPFEVAPRSGDKYKFICEKCGKEFDRSLINLNVRNSGVFCQDCNNSQLEEITKQVLQKYNIKYIPQKEYDGLIGLGNGNLSYDFYLPDYNLLIECQGEQHEHYCKGFHKNKKDFERQLEHDRRKKQYTIDQNINFLEIWYYDIDNIEDILTKQLNLI